MGYSASRARRMISYCWHVASARTPPNHCLQEHPQHRGVQPITSTQPGTTIDTEFWRQFSGCLSTLQGSFSIMGSVLGGVYLQRSLMLTNNSITAQVTDSRDKFKSQQVIVRENMVNKHPGVIQAGREPSRIVEALEPIVRLARMTIV